MWQDILAAVVKHVTVSKTRCKLRLSVSGQTLGRAEAAFSLVSFKKRAGGGLGELMAVVMLEGLMKIAGRQLSCIVSSLQNFTFDTFENVLLYNFENSCFLLLIFYS